MLAMPAALRRPLLVLAACFSGYALLAALLAFLTPPAAPLFPPRCCSVCALTGAAGLACWANRRCALAAAQLRRARGRLGGALANLLLFDRRRPGARRPARPCLPPFALTGIARRLWSASPSSLLSAIDLATARHIMLARARRWAGGLAALALAPGWASGSKGERQAMDTTKGTAAQRVEDLITFDEHIRHRAAMRSTASRLTATT